MTLSKRHLKTIGQAVLLLTCYAATVLLVQHCQAAHLAAKTPAAPASAMLMQAVLSPATVTTASGVTVSPDDAFKLQLLARINSAVPSAR